MEQHAVPQQISSYQFHLVGDMTLKQFFQISGGGLAALLIYASPFPNFIKWPLIISFLILGVALAFLPIEERPLDVWLVAFFRSIYAPTFFFWKKSDPNVAYFMPETTTTTPAPALTVKSASPTDASTAKLEETEKNYFKKITNLLTGAHPTSTPIPPLPANPTAASNLNPVEPVAQPIVPNMQAISPLIPAPSAPHVVTAAPQAVEIPTVEAPTPTVVTTAPVTQILPGKQTPINSSIQATFSVEAAPPLPPEKGNIIVGQVLEQNGKIVESAILEVKDTQGRPARALKTNKAGHFMIVTPLANGMYDIEVEKEGLTFDKIQIEAKGDLIAPIIIKSK